MYDKKVLERLIELAWKGPASNVNWSGLEHVVLSILESGDVPRVDKPEMIAEAFAAFTRRGCVRIKPE